MAKVATSGKSHTNVFKRTSQGGTKPKTSSMNRTKRKTYKAYRGQGK
jgi:hypothetical protein